MIFSKEMVIEAKNSTYQSKEIKNSDLSKNHSFFIESLGYILESDNNINSYLYSRAFNEGKLGNRLEEWLASTNKFNEIIVKILKWIKESIRKLFDNLNVVLVNIFANRKDVIKINQKKLLSYKYPVHYKGETYQYVNLDVNINTSTFKTTIQNDYNILMQYLEDFKSSKNNFDIYQVLDELKSRIQNTDDEMDRLRQSTIDSYYPIPEDEYAEELFNHFRNGGRKISNIDIAPETIREYANINKNYGKSIMGLKKDRRDIENTCDDTISKINKIKLKDYVSEQMDTNTLNGFTQLLNDYIKRTKTVCNIYIQFVSAKLDAYKESRVDILRILMTACNDIMLHKNEGV